MNVLTINLADYNFNSDSPHVLAGEENGKLVRACLALDAIDETDDLTIDFVIPEYLWSVNPSFVRGMFTDSVRRLGEFRFRAKYRFNSDYSQVAYNITTSIHTILEEM